MPVIICLKIITNESLVFNTKTGIKIIFYTEISIGIEDIGDISRMT